VDLGLGVREVAAARDRLSELVPAVLALRLLLAGVLIVVAGGAAYLLLPEPDRRVVALYTLTLAFVAMSTRWVHLGLERAPVVAIARTAGELLMVAGVLAFVRDPADLAKAPLWQLAGDALAAILLAVSLGRLGYRVIPRWRLETIRPLVHRAVPYVGSTLLGLMIYNADLIFLRALRGPESVGHYAAAYAPVSLVLNVGVAYALSLLPTLTRLHPEPAAQQGLYHTSAAHVMAGALPIAVGGFVLAPAIIGLVFGADYAPAALPLRVLMLSVPISLVRDVPVMAVLSRGREDLVLRVVAASATTNLVLNAALIPKFGMLGAAAATLSTEILRFALSLGYAGSLGFPRPDLVRAWRPMAAALAMAIALVAMRPSNLLLGVSVGAVVYVAALALVGGIRRGQDGLPELRV
jgi:O-antigen/teichoic acid export membrane protein